VISRIATLAGVSAALAVSLYLGWDRALWDPRLQLGLHLIAAVAIGGIVVIAWRGGLLPRTPLDRPIAALLVAYGVATVSAWNIGLSVPALAVILATTAMLWVGLVALRHRPDWTAILVVVPLLGLAAGTVAVLAWRRVEWVLAGGIGWPPIRLPQEGTPFGSVDVPPFVILAALPVALLVSHRRLRRGLVIALLAVGLPLTVLSGSRSAWIAIAVAGLVMVVPLTGKLRRMRLRSLGQVAGIVGIVAVAALLFAYIAPRLTETSSLAYRERLWDATLTVWRGDPWLGIGPGAMPYARQTVAPLLQPHSHDVALGILGDAGIVGLVAALVVFVAFLWVARPRAGSTLPGRAAYAALVGIAIGFLTEDLTFLPNFNLLLLLLVGIALLDAGAVSWRPVRLRVGLLAPAAVATAGLLVCVLLGDAAAVSYGAGTEAAAVKHWATAQDRLAIAVTLDPLQPSGAKALAVAADWNGSPALALRGAQLAVQLNPGDGASWTNLSLLCLAERDPVCALDAVGHALRASGHSPISLVNAAVVYAALNQPVAADAAYRASLLATWQTSLVLPWPRIVPLGDQPASERGSTVAQLNLLVARRVQGEPLRPAAYASASIRAVALTMAGDVPAARIAIARAMIEAPGDPVTWDLIALLRRHWGEDDSAALKIGAAIRGASLAAGAPRMATLTSDIAALRNYPADALVSGAKRFLTDGPWPWVLDPLLPG
jgi:O-antigen ligase